jgi:hypothetical protein
MAPENLNTAVSGMAFSITFESSGRIEKAAAPVVKSQFVLKKMSKSGKVPTHYGRRKHISSGMA